MSMGAIRSLAPMTPVLMHCPRCERPVTIPPGHGIRLPNDNPSHCHEVVHLKSGKVYAKGEPRG